MRKATPATYRRFSVLTGIMIDGGYAKVMIIDARGTATIPDGLESVKAAPLLCAGVTTFTALRNASLRTDALVAIQGIGGLGHLGIQYARRMGFRTVAIGLGPESEKLTKDLSAHAVARMASAPPGARSLAPSSVWLSMYFDAF